MGKTLQIIAVVASLMFFGSNNATAQYIVHIAGNSAPNYGAIGDGGPAMHASFYMPSSICRDDTGNLYIGDRALGGLTNVVVRKISASTGIITTIAGNVSAAAGSDSMNNVPATSVRLSAASGMCIDKSGNLLIANMTRIIKVNMSTGIRTTVAGKYWLGGYSGDGGPVSEAILGGVPDITVDAANNIYFVDNHSSLSCTVRRIDAITTIITTVAGTNTLGYNGDGIPATTAKLCQPNGLCLDTAGNIYIADGTNHRIRKVAVESGIITTVAGTGVPGYSGDEGPATAAQLSQPARVTFDKQGNLFINDGGSRIRKIAAGTGFITTYAGTATYPTGPDTVGDGGLAIAAPMRPYALCTDTCGNLYMGSAVKCIRAITPVLPTGGILCGTTFNAITSPPANKPQELHIYPNPNEGIFTLRLTSPENEPILITITDITGRKIKELSSTTNKDTPLQLNTPPGMYFITVSSDSGKWSRKMVME